MLKGQTVKVDTSRNAKYAMIGNLRKQVWLKGAAQPLVPNKSRATAEDFYPSSKGSSVPAQAGLHFFRGHEKRQTHFKCQISMYTMKAPKVLLEVYLTAHVPG